MLPRGRCDTFGFRKRATSLVGYNFEHPEANQSATRVLWLFSLSGRNRLRYDSHATIHERI